MNIPWSAVASAPTREVSDLTAVLLLPLMQPAGLASLRHEAVWVNWNKPFISEIHSHSYQIEHTVLKAES